MNTSTSNSGKPIYSHRTCEFLPLGGIIGGDPVRVKALCTVAFITKRAIATRATTIKTLIDGLVSRVWSFRRSIGLRRDIVVVSGVS